MRRLLASFALWTLLLPGAAWAVLPDELLSDPSLEARARAISSTLRCLVCQNESIDDSGAALARDLRLLVRERLKGGDSDQQVRDFLVARYGDFVLLKPPLEPATALLWGMPLIVLAAGGIAIVIAVRRAQPPQPAPLAPAEQAAVDSLLGPRR